MSSEFQRKIDEINAAEPYQRARMLNELANQAATTQFNALRASPGWQPQKPHTIPALARAAICMMVKDEADVIAQNLEHHYNLGFRRFFILENNSTDATGLLIADFRARYPEARVFCASDFVVGYIQAVKMNALARFAETYLQFDDEPLEWMFFIDADEFITPAFSDIGASVSRLAAMLENPEFNLIYFHWAQCASSSLLRDIPDHTDLFATFSVVWQKMAVPVPKVAIRVGKGLQVIQGNHSVESYPYPAQSAALAAGAGFYMFHFPNRTVEQLRRKLVNANLALQPGRRSNGIENTAGHWRTYFEWYTEHGDVALENILKSHIQDCQKQ